MFFDVIQASNTSDTVLLDVSSDPYGACSEHFIDDDGVIEYFDGVFVASCRECGDVIRLNRIPGGSLLSRAKALLDIVDTSRTDSVHKMEFLILKAFLKEDIAAIRDTANVLARIEEQL